jgi:hypothetical protein
MAGRAAIGKLMYTRDAPESAEKIEHADKLIDASIPNPYTIAEVIE